MFFFSGKNKPIITSEIYFQLHFVVGAPETPLLDMRTHVSSRTGRPLPVPLATQPQEPPATMSPPASSLPSRAPHPWLCTHTTLTNTHDTDISTQDLPTLQHNLLQLQKTQGAGGTSELF